MASSAAAGGATTFDRRRVRGPEHSLPPVYSAKHFQRQEQEAEDGSIVGGHGGGVAAAVASSSKATAATAVAGKQGRDTSARGRASGGGTEGQQRHDGRRADEPRPIFLRTGLISRAAGSAYLETTTSSTTVTSTLSSSSSSSSAAVVATSSGGSSGIKLACAVYGPKPKPPPFASRGGLSVEVKYAPFASEERKAPMRDTEPPHLSSLLHAALLPAIRLETLPKSSIDVHVLVLESPSISSGVEATLAAALSCASAAIADAGIAMSGLAVGTVAAAFTSEGGGDGGAPPQRSSSSSTIRLDPDAREGAEASAIVSVGTLPALDLVTDAWMTGEAEVEEVVAMIDAAVKASAQAHGVVAQALLQGVSERERAAAASVPA